MRSTEVFAPNRSCRSSARRTEHRIFSPNYCPYLRRGIVNRDDRHRKSGRLRRQAIVAASTSRPLLSMRPTEERASADQLPSKGQRRATHGKVTEARRQGYGAREGLSIVRADEQCPSLIPGAQVSEALTLPSPSARGRLRKLSEPVREKSSIRTLPADGSGARVSAGLCSAGC